MKLKNFFTDILFDIAGGFCYGTGLVCFLNSCNIAPGGVSGISIMLNYLFDFPIGLTGFLINIPIIILGYLYLDKKIIIKTLKSILIVTVIIDCIITPFFPTYTNDRILGALFGGLLLGLGLSIIFRRGSTTGGTDILSYLIKLKHPHISVGKAMILIDCAVIVASVLAFRNVESALYAIIGLFLSASVLDAMLYGADRGTIVFIISKRNDEISRQIITDMKRGATLIKAHGGYTGGENGVLMCAVRRYEYVNLKKIINQTDPEAFFIVSHAEEISGEGFRIS